MNGWCRSVLADIYLYLYGERITENEEIKNSCYIDDILLVMFNDVEKNYSKCYLNTFNLELVSISKMFTI